MGVSIRGYARHRGCDDKAVRKAIASGRISTEPDGTIDVAKADREWAENTDASQQRGADDVGETLAEADAHGGDGGTISFAKAQTAEKVFKAQMAKHRLQVAKEQVVDRAAAMRLFYAEARKQRDAWVTWPARVAAIMAGELGVEIHDVERILEREVRDQCARIAEVKFDLG